MYTHVYDHCINYSYIQFLLSLPGISRNAYIIVLVARKKYTSTLHIAWHSAVGKRISQPSGHSRLYARPDVDLMLGLRRRQWTSNVDEGAHSAWPCTCKIKVDTLVSTFPPLTWSPSHFDKGDTRIILWKARAGSAGFEPGTHAWLARHSGAFLYTLNGRGP